MQKETLYQEFNASRTDLLRFRSPSSPWGPFRLSPRPSLLPAFPAAGRGSRRERSRQLKTHRLPTGYRASGLRPRPVFLAMSAADVSKLGWDSSFPDAVRVTVGSRSRSRSRGRLDGGALRVARPPSGALRRGIFRARWVRDDRFRCIPFAQEGAVADASLLEVRSRGQDGGVSPCDAFAGGNGGGVGGRGRSGVGGKGSGRGAAAKGWAVSEHAWGKATRAGAPGGDGGRGDGERTWSRSGVAQPPSLKLLAGNFHALGCKLRAAARCSRSRRATLAPDGCSGEGGGTWPVVRGTECFFPPPAPAAKRRGRCVSVRAAL